MKPCLGIRFTKNAVELDAGAWHSDVRERHSCPRQPEGGLETAQQALKEAFEQLRRRSQRTAQDFAGAGFVFDPDGLRPGIENEQALAKLVGDTLGLPVIAEVETVAAAVAEYRLGAGQKANALLVVEADSTIRAALIVSGRAYRGCRSGLIPLGELQRGSLPRHIPSAGATVNSVASIPAMISRAQRAIAEWNNMLAFIAAQSSNPHHAGRDAVSQLHFHPQGRRFERLLSLANGEPNAITFEFICKAAIDSDRLSLELLSDAADALGWAIGQAAILFQPERVVLRGVVARELFEPFLHQAIERHVSLECGPEVILSDWEGAALTGAQVLAAEAFGDLP